MLFVPCCSRLAIWFENRGFREESYQRPALGSPEFAATTPISLPEFASSSGKATVSPFNPSTIWSIFLNWYGHLLLYRNCLRSNLLSSGE